MPLGLNRTDLNTTGTSYRNGSPVTLPKSFGNPVTLPKNFGNPVELPKDFGNPVNWATPDPTHFGNLIGGGGAGSSGFELEDISGLILLEDGNILLLENQ